ncbi:MAG: hypothetical protein RSD40_04325, partial [Bacilli bacterium]
MVNLSEVTKNLTEYEVENPNRLEEVRRIINSHSLDWDTKLPDENGKDVEILLLLLYEYSTQIEKVTQGRVSYRYVLDKIANSVGKIRLGELKDGDEHIQYGKSLNDRSAMIVKSKEFDLQVRAKGYGAGHFDYIDDNKEHKSAVAIFGKKTIQDKDGRNVFIKGAEFNDLSDLRQTMFHEWTHEMELEILTEKDFEQRDLPLRK